MSKEDLMRSAEVNIRLELINVSKAVDIDTYYGFLTQIENIIQMEKKLAMKKLSD